MNGKPRLNSEMVKEFLAKEDRKLSYLCRVLSCSKATVDKIVNRGHVPDGLRLKTLAGVMGVEVDSLLIPREDLVAS